MHCVSKKFLLILFHSGCSVGSLLCSLFIFTSAQGPVNESRVSGCAGMWGLQKLDVLLSLQVMEPRIIRLCQKWASLELPSCSSHLRPLWKHLAQRHIAAKRSLYSVSTGLRSPLCRRENRRSYFLSPPFQASTCAHAIVWGMCSEGKNIGLCIVVKNHVWGGEVNTLLSLSLWTGSANLKADFPSLEWTCGTCKMSRMFTQLSGFAEVLLSSPTWMIYGGIKSGKSFRDKDKSVCPASVWCL